MKKTTKQTVLIILLCIAICFSNNLLAQTIKQDSNGNYYQVKDSVNTGKETGKTFTDTKGQKYNIYESKNGKLYIIRTSKSGNVYKSYLKLEN